jgi:hypothetical protein
VFPGSPGVPRVPVTGVTRLRPSFETPKAFERMSSGKPTLPTFQSVSAVRWRSNHQSPITNHRSPLTSHRSSTSHLSLSPLTVLGANGLSLCDENVTVLHRRICPIYATLHAEVESTALDAKSLHPSHYCCLSTAAVSPGTRNGTENRAW